MGETGLTIIRAIVAGERDTQMLAAFRDRNCKKSAEEIGKALTGTWREEHLLCLKQSLELYDFYTQQMEVCDEEIDRLYALTRPDWEGGELPPLPKKKRNSHSKNAPQNRRGDPQAFEAHQRRGFECGGWIWGIVGADGDHGSGDGHE